MRILVYGAGVIGSIYAVYLLRSDCEVTMFARGRRLEELRNRGLLFRDGKRIGRAAVDFLDKLEPDDRYDYIFLTVRAGGSIRNGILDAGLTPRLIQPTTFAEIDGSRTERIDMLKRILTRAGIPFQIVPDMHAWQICHLAMVVPLADAYYMVNDPKLVHRDKTVMRKTAQALHDHFAQLKSRGDPISPPKLNLFRLCPVGLMARILPFVYNGAFGDRFMYQHAMKAKEEMDALHKQFYGYLYDGGAVCL